MSLHKKYWVSAIGLASLSAVVTYAAHKNPTYGSLDPDEPARTAPMPTDWSVANRKPAVEPRVYVESADSNTGFVYYDYPNQVRHAEPKPPRQ